MDSIEHFPQWDEKQLVVGERSTSYLVVPWDKTTIEYLETNPTRNLLMSWKYIHHLVKEAQSVSGYAFQFYSQRNLVRSPGKSS